MKKPQMSKTTIDYMEFASPKKERLHKKVNFQKSTIFNDNEEPPQFRPQKKQVELYIQETETRPRKKINSPTSTNPLGYTEMNIDKLRKSKVRLRLILFILLLIRTIKIALRIMMDYFSCLIKQIHLIKKSTLIPHSFQANYLLKAIVIESDSIILI